MIDLLLDDALTRRIRSDAPPAPGALRISLLGGFSASVDDEAIDGLPSGCQRLLVFLALRDRPVARIAVAGIMWPEVTAQRAGDSLRSALARLGRLTRAGVTLSSAELGLGPDVDVDYRDALALARRLLDAGAPLADGDLAASAISVLSHELLPDWADDWILVESDEWRHLRASALEALALRLLHAGRLAEAEGAARAAIRVDPLRETPHATLIRIHLSGGNQSDAIGTFDRYRVALHDALGIAPTAQLSDLVGAIGNETGRR